MPCAAAGAFNESTPDNKLVGIYSTGPLHFLPVNLEVYRLSVDNAGVTINGTSGRERRQTLGARTWGKIGQTQLDFEVEGAGQFGTVGRGNIAAGMLTTSLGYPLPVPDLSPASTSSSNMRAETASPAAAWAPSTCSTDRPLIPGLHRLHRPAEHHRPSAGVAMSPVRDLTLSLQQYFFWRASDRDPLHNKSGAVFRPGTGTTARYVGAEIDLFATYNLTRRLLGYVGYSHFFPGEFIRKTGPSRESDFLYSAIQYTF